MRSPASTQCARVHPRTHFDDYAVYQELLAFTCSIFSSRFFTRSQVLVSLAFNTGLVQGGILSACRKVI